MKKLLFFVAGVYLAVSVNAQTVNWSNTYNYNSLYTGQQGASLITGGYQSTNAPGGGTTANYFNVWHQNFMEPLAASSVAIGSDNNLYSRIYNGSWSSWNKYWHSGNLNKSDVDFTARNIYANGYMGIGTSPSNPLHIQYNINSGSLLYGLNNQPMGTAAMSYSPNLFLMHTRLDACLGLHAYVYRKSASTSWTGGTVRFSSSADGDSYSQDNRYNNLNWIDFIGNGNGIDLGCIDNDPALSIRGKLIGIGTTSPSNPLHIQYNINSGSLLYGLNNQPMGTAAMSYSPNLFLMHTRLDACLGLHAYVYRKSASTSWTGGTVRFSSAADGDSYSQDNRYNNLNWIDFIGNGSGIDLGCVNNEPAISIRDRQVGIGTTNPQNALDVNGTIHAREVKVDLTGWSDFVFAPSYKLKTLIEVEQYIKTNGHLPEIPSNQEVEQKGVNIGDMQAKLLQKVEELTLYSIEQSKQLQEQRQSNAALQQQLTAQAKEIEQLKQLINQKLK
jgi:hypothetical protein